jgi:hypothetical protein
MDSLKRKTLLALLALPAGCTVRSLAPLPTESLPGPQVEPKFRPPALGQSWTYQKFNTYNGKLLATEREEVVSLEPNITLSRKTDAGVVLPDEQHRQWGQVVRDPAWDQVQNYEEPVPLWPQSLAVGSSSSFATHYRLDNGTFRFAINVYTLVKAWEKVVLPQGEFNALRLEKWIRQDHFDVARIETVRRDVVWLVPEIGRWAAREISGQYRYSGQLGPPSHEDSFRWELKAWT